VLRKGRRAGRTRLARRLSQLPDGKKRNEIERLFRRLQTFRRIFTRFEKPDVIFLAFLCFAFIIEALRLV
jgi:hypothetical protein